MRIRVLSGDITLIDCEAIVNPANSLMIMGGGVAGAIKRRGGQRIEEKARKHAPVPIGKAISTGAGRLRARYVIHAPTMEKPAQRTTRENVYKAIIAALEEALRLKVKCIAFPGMGTGVGGLSHTDFLSVFKKALLEYMDRLQDVEVILVAFEEDLYRKAQEILSDL